MAHTGPGLAAAAVPPAEAVPDEQALFLSGRRQRTRAALLDKVRRAAAGFSKLGLGQGDCVALLLRNDFAYFEASQAALTIGVYPVPINWHWKPAEVAYLLRDCGARVVVVHEDLIGLLAEAPADLLRLVVATPEEIAEAYAIGTHDPAAGESWEGWLARQDEWTAAPLPPRESMIYTSGTTGRPKGVRREAATPVQAIDGRCNRALIYGIRPGMRALVPGTLYHSAPNNFALGAAPVAGLLVLMPKFEAEGFLRLVQEHRITTAFVVPTMMVRLLRLPAGIRNQYDLGSLQHVVHAGAPCAPEVKRAFIDWIGPVVHEFYGATEVGALTHSDSEEWLRKPGTVGRCNPGAEIRILDDAGAELPAGMPGEIFGRTTFMPPFRYHNRPEEAAGSGPEGYVSVGDVGYLDQDGYLFLCDRKRDMVISAGVNIYPAEIEAALLEIEGVEDCGVFGIPDAEYGESLCAAVIARPGTTESTIRAALSARLANFKVPKKIELRDTLPRDDSGKLLKRLLREPYWRDLQRRI